MDGRIQYMSIEDGYLSFYETLPQKIGERTIIWGSEDENVFYTELYDIDLPEEWKVGQLYELREMELTPIRSHLRPHIWVLIDSLENE